MILVNTNDVPGKKIVEVYGLVRGNTIHAKHLGKDILAALRTLVGGEIKEYTQMMTEAREVAINRMIEQASSMGANGIVNVRFSTSSVMQGAAELLVYGTAVRVE